MRVALALISTMVFLGGIYGLLGVHFIAAFQVLIYVGAVMVFMVYVIMLLEVREASAARATRSCCCRAWSASCCWWARSASASGASLPAPAAATGDTAYGITKFSISFLNEYWLHFELTSVLLVAAVVAATGRHQGQPQEGQPWIEPSCCSAWPIALFSLGLLGVIVRRNVLVMLMCMELMLNGVILSLVTFAQQTATTVGAVLVFLIFVVATAEIALAIPIVLLLVRDKRTLDLDAYTDLKG